ncbi:MAG: hypothetical protein RLZ10_382 [Bacteroidota bacterium]|jgi:hypothetical protein
MKIVITEEQFNNLYNTPDRPTLTEVEYVIDIIHEENENNQSEEDEFDLGGGGESGEHHLYYFYISEAFFDEFYDKTYLELFDQFKDDAGGCENFVNAIIDNILKKMKQSIEEKTAAKILKKVIKRQSTVRFKESDIRKALDAHFGNFICNEFIEETR